MSILLRPIGVVHVDFSDDEVKASWVEGVVEVYEDTLMDWMELMNFPIL